MHKIRLEKHVAARKLNPEIPRELERVIDRCLEKQPRDRWRSAQHMVMALERFLAKHVEMNHHARLVLFIRSQNVITELEADAYLNPAALGGVSPAQQPNMQARHAVRAGLVAHAITLGVLLLMLGLIHVAPLSSTPAYSAVVRQAGRGFLRVNASPWARISIDNAAYGMTPFGKPIELKEGTHRVRLEHDWYQPVERTVDIPEGIATAPQVLSLDFEAERIPAAPGKTRPAAASPGGTAGGGK
jgi:serine/threonine-protein kinase